MSAYIILHADATKTGVFAGVDFFNGRGSVSSMADVARLVALGCRAEDPAVQAQAENLNRLEAERLAAQGSERDRLAALERLPGFLEGKRRHRLGRRSR